MLSNSNLSYNQIHKTQGQSTLCALPFQIAKNALSYENVGASIARPPKIFDFRIFRRKITVFFDLRRQILLWQNLRTSDARPYNGILRLFRAVCAALGVEHIQAVGHGVDDGEDVLLGGLLAAGEGDDEGAPPDAGHTSAQATLGGDAHTLCTHGLGDAGGGTLENFHGGLGGDVPGGEAGAAGGQDQGDA